MKVYLLKNRRNTAQAMIEFALVFPILLLLIYGIVEFGRMIFIYSAVTTASREASRYGSAAGASDTGIPRYLDEDGIRLAARRSLIAIAVPDDDITILYDCGPATNTPSPDFQDCTSTQAARVLVQVDATYEPIFNNVLFEMPIIPISAESSRTIMREIAIEGTPAPVTSGSPDVFFATADFTTAAETGVIGVELRLTASISSPVIVDLAASGTAALGADYTISENPVIIPAGSVTKTVTLTIVEDTVPEYNETAVLTIVNAVGANIGAPSAFTLTITDDDPPPYVVFTTQTASVSEAGGGVLVNVALNAAPDGSGAPVPAPGDVTAYFNVGGTAVIGSDYSLPVNSVTIPSGATAASYTILVLDDVVDPIDELDENVLLGVSAVTGLARADGTTSYNLTIVDNETARVSWETNAFTIGEKGGAVTVRINITPRSDQDVPVSFTRSGTAGASDYTLTASPVTIGRLTTGYDLTLTPVDDALVESETIILTLQDPANADLGTYPQLTIRLEDGNVIQPITVKAFSPASYNEGTFVPVTFMAGGPVVENVTINFTLGGTASYTGTANYVAGHIDYTIPSLSVTIPQGAASVTTNIALALDGVDEVNETVSIAIQSLSSTYSVIGSPASQTFSIVDVNAMPQVAFTAISRNYNEGTGRVEVPVSIYPMSDRTIDLSFYYAITSTASADPTSLFYAYDVLSTTLSVPAYTSVISLPVGLPANFYVDQPERVLYIQIATVTPTAVAQRSIPYQFEMRIAEVDVCATAGAIAPFPDNQKKITLSVLNSASNNRPLVLTGVQLYETTGNLPGGQSWVSITYSSLGTYLLPSPQLLDMSSPYTSIAPPGVTYDLPQNSSVTIIFTLSKNLGGDTRYAARLIFQDATLGSTFTCPLTITEP